MVGVGKTGILLMACMAFVHLTMRSTPNGASKTSALHECLVWSKVLADGGGGGAGYSA